MPWPDLLISIAFGMGLIWSALVIALWKTKPADANIREALRVLPDLVRFLKRLLADRTLPRGVRVRVGLLLGYLALPIDLVPDFIPVLGFADDAIAIALVLRSVVRLAGSDALDEHWPGTADGLHVVQRLCRLPTGREYAG